MYYDDRVWCHLLVKVDGQAALGFTQEGVVSGADDVRVQYFGDTAVRSAVWTLVYEGDL